MPSDERDGLSEGIEHLQAAAREMIQATRSLLDAAEGLVEDPAALRNVVGTLSGLAQAAAGRLRPDATAGDDPDDPGKVQHIKIS
jgi:hypothetical protein